MLDLQSAEDLQKNGEKAFKGGRLQKAIELYTNALELGPEQKLRIILYQSRAIAKFKIEDYEGVEDDCTKILDIDKSDSKALYRRALAREKLDKLNGALQDAKKALTMDTKNRSLQRFKEKIIKLKSATSEEKHGINFNKCKAYIEQLTENNTLCHHPHAFDPSTAYNPLSLNDICIQPGTKIVFSASSYGQQQIQNITISNPGGHRIRWAIKTTNMKRLGVDLPCGVLDPKEAVLIAVSCDSFKLGSEDTNNDHITIKWTNTPDGATKQFRYEWFKRDGGMIRRRDLQVEYAE